MNATPLCCRTVAIVAGSDAVLQNLASSASILYPFGVLSAYDLVDGVTGPPP